MLAQQTRFYASPNGIKIHFLEYGDGGPDVLLIPGITSPAITWGFVAERLVGSAHVYVMDVRGRGLSDQRPGLGHRLDDYAADAAGLIEALGLTSPVIVGHSMGARVGIRLASRFPQHVGRLVLADPPVSGPGRRPYPLPLQNYLTMIEKTESGEGVPKPPTFTEAQHRQRLEWLPTCNKEAVLETHRSFHEEDIFGDMPSVRCPTLLLYAELGGTITDDDAKEITSSIVNATSAKLRGIGHMMPWDNLELFLQSFQGFIHGGAKFALGTADNLPLRPFDR
jgi:N-formylmaleamate deformylase